MQCEMSIMDTGAGDIKQMWDSDNPDEVEVARKQFEECTEKKRMLAFRVDKKGNKSEQIKTFDAKAEAIILVPQVCGG